MSHGRNALLTAAAIAVLAACNNGSNGGGDSGLGAPAPAPAAGTIYAFGGTGAPAQDGAEPKGSLTAVTVNGSTVLFGRTAIGGTSGCGTIFSLNPDGSNYNVQYRFGGSDGCDPRHDAMVVNPADGKVYGTTQGLNQTNNATYGNWGQAFSFSPATSIPYPINAVHTFANPSPTKAPYDGAQQHSSFSIDPGTGFLYGQTAAGGANGNGMLYAMQSDGSQFTDLYDFPKDGGTDPHGRIVLVSGTQKVLYGITRKDGLLSTSSSGSKNYGYGTVFAFTLNAAGTGGTASVLHVFGGAPDDGALSDHGYVTPVTVNGRTLLYGMTQCGGAGPKNANCKGNGDGSGVIFAIDPSATPGSSGAYAVIYSFQATSSKDGAMPYGSLMYDGTYLYGTTSAGGKYGNGTVFRFAPVAPGSTATVTLLYEFGGQANDGIKPIDNVIKVGNTLYGMTVYGGVTTASPDNPDITGNGTVFAIPLPN
ncbi:MAG: choice-of-anchor tandem repeat GloVer-containing protein [Burkholderiales bacterium]